METRRSARLPKYDYGKQGVYFVTLCTYQRQCTLLTVGRDDLGAPSLRLSVIGKIVEHYIRTIPGAYPYVSIDSYVIMPNHVHMLISVLRDDGAPRSSRPTELVPRIIAVLKRFSNQDAGRNLWQRSFYDHIIRDDTDYAVKYNYILDNPRRWAEDEYYSNR